MTKSARWRHAWRRRTEPRALPRRGGRITRLAVALPCMVLAPIASLAQQPPATQEAPPPASGFWEQPNLLGDLGGLRTALGKAGITLGLQDANEVFANLAGGRKRGASGNGLATVSIDVDTAKAFGWAGGTIHTTVLGIYGPNFSTSYIDGLQTPSSIAAAPTVRLWELWFDQASPGGTWDIRLGLQSADQEFIVSQGASLFLSSSMGWPVLTAADLYGGGPAYPLSSLAARLKLHVSDSVTVLGGVFQDNPPGGPFFNDGQLRGGTRYGLNVNLRTGALFIAELQYAINQPATGPNGQTVSHGLPGTYKLGAWFDTASFPDQRYDTNGLSLANPASNGMPLMHRGNVSLYAVADQVVWQPGGKDPRSLDLFLRPMIAPADRNLVDFSLNAGATLKAPLPSRDNDTVGIGFGLASISPRAAALASDMAAFSGSFVPSRGSESFLELTYQAQITPWLVVQPDAQYVWMPGGGLANPDDPGKRIGNAFFAGVRVTLTL